MVSVFSRRYEKGTTVKVLKSHIEVIQRTDDAGDGGGGEERRTITLDHVSLIPASCHGLKWVPGDGMHFRMQVNPDRLRLILSWIVSQRNIELNQK